ncbi:hypothetical protein EV06_1369 [Prochlorococcus sp. MIT 0602]|nr:hypothetical protein EV06_1369 [Prochlorococcus sp. MIT 0602]KGG17777.1 hypothetical protein EV07_1217 [Prochlorococcus sp. MIT 0603]
MIKTISVKACSTRGSTIKAESFFQAGRLEHRYKVEKIKIKAKIKKLLRSKVEVIWLKNKDRKNHFQ